MTQHSQCLMERDTLRTVAWIPVEFATAGRLIDLRDADTREWSKGWTVIEAGAFQRDSDFVRDRSQDHKNMRKMTDI